MVGMVGNSEAFMKYVGVANPLQINSGEGPDSPHGRIPHWKSGLGRSISKTFWGVDEQPCGLDALCVAMRPEKPNSPRSLLSYDSSPTRAEREEKLW